MKAAVLCNGPSRNDYEPSTDYGFTIGCNIPWTKVDATVIIDTEIIHYLAKHSELIIPSYFSRKAWMVTDGIKKRNLFEPYLIELVDPNYTWHSAGHIAAEIMIRKGFTEIDIFGCDSWFENTLESHTHKYSDTSSFSVNACINGWKTRWKTMMENNPNVSLNFIRKLK
jgi:hypothetical protein